MNCRCEAAQGGRPGAGRGHRVTDEVEPTEEWPEPSVPPDLRKALSNAPQKIKDLWQAITPMARWEWVRWVNATRNPDTRRRRVEVSLSKLNGGKRRPCCFNPLGVHGSRSSEERKARGLGGMGLERFAGRRIRSACAGVPCQYRFEPRDGAFGVRRPARARLSLWLPWHASSVARTDQCSSC